MGFAISTRGAGYEVGVLNVRYAHLKRHMIEAEPPALSKLLICPMPGLQVDTVILELE